MDVFREHSGKAEAEADAWLAGLRADDRYLEDVWGGSTTSPPS
jgi:cytochrome P450/NADPH-cytochrome P450 reductase